MSMIDLKEAKDLMMSRLNKADDIIELALLMQNSYQGITIEEIADKFGYSRRSAERMKTVLAERFYDKIEEVQNSSDRKKRWRFKKGSMNFLITFSDIDFANLEMIKELLGNENKKKEIDELIEKIKALNPTKAHNADIEAMLEAQGFAVKQYPREKINNLVLEKIQYSILAMKKLKFTYTNNEKNTAEIIVYPYGVLVSGKQYLVAYNEYYEKIWIYKISKISEIAVLDEYFDKDESFDFKKYTEKSFGVFQGEVLDVCLEFDEKVKEDVLNYHFHPSQKIKELENGKIEVKFSANGSYEIITELLKWRDSVKIIAPETLKEEYKNEIEKMYRKVSE
jgi:predicted DNA-binding transcriptional regulator YafY